MGGKNSKRTIYDYLMSIDYGVCVGPLDSVNQIWVKDRPIFCGTVQVRTDVDIRLPGLFGGDNGEGGCVGDVEVYMGTPDQLASRQLASRNGTIPEVHPGYRNISHLFFRGSGPVHDSAVADLTLDEDGNVVSDPDEFSDGDETRPVGQGLVILGSVANVAINAVYGMFSDFLGDRKAPTGGEGFRWTSNNPYLPTAKVHVTRVFDMGLNQFWAMIYPIEFVLDDGTLVPYENHLFEPVVDVFSIDLTDESPTDDLIFDIGDILGPQVIDNGDGYLEISMSAFAYYYGLGGDGPADGVIAAFFDFYDAEGNNIGGAPPLTGSFGDTGNGQLNFTASAKITARARSVRINPDWVLFLPWLAKLRDRNFTASFKPGTFSPPPDDDGSGGGGGGGGGHCTPGGDGLRTMPNANPAHIIYEAMTNAEWGMGGSPASFNIPSFDAAARTLFDEFMGMFIKWIQQGSIETLVGEVLDHINAVLFQDPSTGLWNLKLLRDDYVAADQPLLDPSNCTAKNRKRRAWGETVNEIIVKWTDPLTEKSASVAAHNLANISIQGATISETRDYYAIRDEIVAQQLAERDVLTAGYPLFTAEIYVDRSEWQIVPGDIRRFSWPEDGLTEIVVRVLDVDRNEKDSRQIKLSVTEDIFSVDQTSYAAPQRGFWTGPNETPVPFDTEFAMDVPLPVILRNGTTLAGHDADYPEVLVSLFGDHDTVPVIDFDAVAEVVKQNGATALETILTAPASRALLTGGPIFAQAFTALSGAFVETLFYSGAGIGDLLVLGPDAAGDHEIVMLDSYDDVADVWTLARGVWDTVPRSWPSGTRLWDFSEEPARVDPEPRAAGETSTYRLLPRTTVGTLDFADAVDIVHTATERAYLPFRPANTQLDSNGFAPLVYDDPDTRPTGMTATWETRNRGTEDRVATYWADPSVAPEVGQTSTLRAYDLDDVLLVSYPDLTDTLKLIPFADLAGAKQGYVTFHSETAAGESLWAARRVWDIRDQGYGKNYGNNYGG
jgi:hypothetical protein